MRLGIRHDLSARSQLLASFLYQNADIGTSFDPGFDFTDEYQGYTTELQHIYRADGWNLVSGIRYIDLNQDATQTVPGFVLEPPVRGQCYNDEFNRNQGHHWLRLCGHRPPSRARAHGGRRCNVERRSRLRRRSCESQGRNHLAAIGRLDGACVGVSDIAASGFVSEQHPAVPRADGSIGIQPVFLRR